MGARALFNALVEVAGAIFDRGPLQEDLRRTRADCLDVNPMLVHAEGARIVRDEVSSMRPKMSYRRHVNRASAQALAALPPIALLGLVPS